jgi:polyisoprenoid-binding protein YceI
MIRTALLAAALLAVPSLALAAPAPAWTVDRAASRLTFTSAYAGDAFSGGFSRWSADIRFDPKNLAGSSVTATIDVGSAATGDKDRDASLPTADFFAAARFPRATFAATRFRDLGGGRYAADGTLTIKGVAKPLTLPFSLAITGKSAKMTSSVAINRLAFGIGQGQWASTQAIPAAATVNIAISATRP